MRPREIAALRQRRYNIKKYEVVPEPTYLGGVRVEDLIESYEPGHADLYPAELDDLPLLVVGATLYDGEDGYPPYVDDNDLYVIAKLPGWVDPVSYTVAYAELLNAQGWAYESSTIDSPPGTATFELLRGLWVFDLTGATLDDGGALILSLTVG